MPRLDRRELLSGALAGTVTASLSAAVAQEPDRPPPRRIIDTNVSLFRWPFRRLPLDTPSKLAEKLREYGVEQAWAGSFEGLLHRDLASVNTRLADACQADGKDLLVPFGSINPTLPDWEEDLRRCVEQHQMPGIRLHPNYHGYQLDDPRFARLLHLAAQRRLIVQLAAAMEDVRTQHPMLSVPDVDLAPLPELLRRIPTANVMILNHKATGAAFLQLLKNPGVTFDIARVNATDGVARVLRTVPAGRVVFGTHAPFLIYEAALIKVEESNLGETDFSAVLAANAQRLLQRKPT